MERTDLWTQQRKELMLLLSRFSRVQLCATPKTAAHQATHPWDSPGKNTGVGCHFLLQCMKVKSESELRSPKSSNLHARFKIYFQNLF